MQPNYPPQYGQYPPQQVHQQAQAQSAAATLDPSNPFSDPSIGGSLAPKARDLVGRTVIVEPRSIDETAEYKGLKRPSCILDLWVVDGPWPLLFGDNQELRTPHTHRIDGPARFVGVLTSSAGFVSEVRNKLGRGISLAVVEQGTKGNRPYLLTSVESTLDGHPRPDAPQRRAAALKLWTDFQAGTWRSPEPVELNPGGFNGAQQHAQPQQGYVNYQPPQSPPPMQQAPQYMQPQQQYVAPPLVPVDPNVAPAGWAQEAWNMFTPEQRQQVLAQQAGSAGPAM